jgi:transitional endoplasmic reticulum ATPase
MVEANRPNALNDAVEKAYSVATSTSQIPETSPFEEDLRLSSLPLRVAKPSGKDIGFNVARVQPDLWNLLCAEENQIVEIRGPKRSTAAFLKLTHEEIGPTNAISLDGLQRRNAGVSVGDKVTVRKVDCADAERIIVAMISSESREIDMSPCVGDYIAGALAVMHKPLSRGDVFVVPGVSHRGNYIPLVVLFTSPDGFVQADGDTILTIQQETVAESDLPNIGKPSN